MLITVNGKGKETLAQTLSELIAELQLPAQGVAAAVNNRIVPRNEWENFSLEENAAITIIKAVCGG
ncbi:ThiS, thiamine-biosynthesis [gut metagenome]|uniref:ThiS, thiamine-biosynthesis n=1 Tax=gut metagenome TaxID=749906 RepID=J9CN11_9ZZZZ